MRKHSKLLIAAVAAAVGLSGCSTLGGEGIGSDYYRLIRVKSTQVGDGSMAVTPPRPWNEARRMFFDYVSQVEDWTLNGPLLDSITFVTGLKSGQYLVRQNRRDERQVPKFRNDMTPPEIASMIESAFRVRAGAIDFRTLSMTPRPFLGGNGFQWDFEHLDNDELWRKGRAVGIVLDGKLYLILFDAARSHYYPDAINDFEAIVNSARRRR